ncbi:O-methyltransferase [Nocardia sp. NPDC004750]
MSDEALPREVCAIVENAMASQKPFGDPVYVLDRLQECLLLRLQLLSAHLPAAAELLDAMAQTSSTTTYKLFADPTLRAAIVHAHERTASGVPQGPTGLRLADCSNLFLTAADYLRNGGTDTPLQDGSLVALGPGENLGWIWREEHSDDTYGRAFRKLVFERYNTLPVTPSDEALDQLVVGARLLNELLPDLAPSALQHARVIACVPQEGAFIGTGSSSQFHLGGVIFLNARLGSPWWVVEHLLHEALHQKFYDFRHGHVVTRLEWIEDDARPVISPWNPSRLAGSNWWSAPRVFAAFHVYVHLALLSRVAEDRHSQLESTYGPFSGMIASKRAQERAHYLGRQLKSLCWDRLDTAGRAYADWLHALLDALDPAPPPVGSTLHLYLDLYRRETGFLHRTASETPQLWAGRADELTNLAGRELDTVRKLLRDLGNVDQLQRLDAATAGLPATDPAQRYADIRRYVEASLLAASVDGYRIDASGDYEAIVQDLVGETSDKIYALSNGIPMPVAEAKRRAVECGFRQSCHDGVGQLLAVLAGNLPQQANVLELGTGVGVGTAWIVYGLGARTDVHVFSAEVDESLGESASSFEWPPYVNLKIIDGASVLVDHGPFDLIFADAPPIKFGHFEAIVDALRPGGTLIVDDMGPKAQSKNPDSTKIPQLREAILGHHELVTADIDWSTGIIIATKRP